VAGVEGGVDGAGGDGQDAAGRVPGRRQKRAPGGRPHKHTVRLTDAQQEIVAARAAAAGVSVPLLLAEAAVAGTAQTASERRAAANGRLAARRLLAAVGNNVNQLAKVANATGVVPPSVEATMDGVLRMLAKLDAAYADPPRRRGPADRELGGAA
jgi:Bacterial mobilisation protein (MobC)